MFLYFLHTTATILRQIASETASNASSHRNASGVLSNNVSDEHRTAVIEDVHLVADYLAVLCWALCLITIVGNVIVIAAFAKDPALQTKTNYWIVSLSLTDIVLATTVMPIAVVQNMSQDVWPFSALFCDLFISLDVLCCSCSIYHLCLISIDRYCLVRYPFAYPQMRTKSRTLAAIACTWLLCVLISMPRLLGWKNASDSSECKLTNKPYKMVSSVLSFYFPLSVTVVMYFLIHRLTRGRAAKFRAQKKQQQTTVPSNVETDMVQPLVTHYGAIALTNPSVNITRDHSSSSVFGENYCCAKEMDAKEHVAAQRKTLAKMCSMAMDHGGAAHKPSRARSKSVPFEPLLNFFARNASTASDRNNGLVDMGRKRTCATRASTRHSICGASASTSCRMLDAGDDDSHRRISLSVFISSVCRMLSSPRASIEACADERNDLLSTRVDDNHVEEIRSRRSALAKPSSISVLKALKLTGPTSQEDKHKKQEQRAARVMAIVLGLFILCWMPFFLTNVVDALCVQCVVTADAWRWVTWLGYANSGVNPFLYTCFNLSFRNAIKSLFSLKAT